MVFDMDYTRLKLHRYPSSDTCSKIVIDKLSQTRYTSLNENVGIENAKAKKGHSKICTRQGKITI